MDTIFTNMPLTLSFHRSLYIVLLTLFVHSFSASAQPSDGKVSSVLAAENYFSALSAEKGIKKAFLTVSDEHTIVFKPGPQKAVDFYKKVVEHKEYLSWTPTYALISRSGDWALTLGPYVYRDSIDAPTAEYGSYFSIWKANGKGIWKLALDAGIEHPQPKTEHKLSYRDATDTKFFKQLSPNRLQQRDDIVYSTDKLFSNIQKAQTRLAFAEFLAHDAQLLFPGSEPVKGKEKILDFLYKKNLKITSEITQVDRALGGDLAYTYGTATVQQNNGGVKDFYYVRIWQIQPGYLWNVLIDMYIPA